MFNGKIIFGKSLTNLEKIGALISIPEYKIMYMDYDDKNWTRVGVWLTPEIFDEMAQDWNKYDGEYFLLNPIVVNNGENCSIPKGKYEIWEVERIDEKLQNHSEI